jgi:hypothetical protein
VCVTGSTDTLAYGKCRSESVISKKIPVFFDDNTIRVLQSNKGREFLEKEMGMY